MKCPYCKNEISEDIVRCIYCGNIVKTQEESEKKTKSRTEDERQKKEHDGPIKELDDTKDSEKEEKGQTGVKPAQKRKIPLPVLLLAVVIAAAMIGSGIIKSGITIEHDAEERTEAQAQAGSEGEQDIQADDPQGAGPDQDSGEDGRAPGETQTASGKTLEAETLSDPAAESKGADAQQENAETQTVV